MTTLRLMPAEPGVGNHGGEVFGCAYTPDSTQVLTGGWDGHLRLWDAATGAHVLALKVSPKPVSACVVSPDGKTWYSGALDGLLSSWDAKTKQRTSATVPSGRPLSALVFSADEKTLATASWDGNLMLLSPSKDRDTRMLSGHNDIVAGCRFSPCGQFLLSWSHDGSVRYWDTTRGVAVSTFRKHTDRVTAGAVATDGRWAATGSRDRCLKLWDLQTQAEVASETLSAEVRACFFLLDGETLVAIDAQGRITLHALPDLKRTSELATKLAVQCATQALLGSQLALGCDDGRIRFVAVDGIDHVPLAVTATKTSKRTATRLQKLFGRSQIIHAVAGTCPVCRQEFERPTEESSRPWQCPGCQRSLRVGLVRPEALLK